MEKKIKNWLMILLMAAIVMPIAACGDDDEDEPENPNETEQLASILPGTTWTCEQSVVCQTSYGKKDTRISTFTFKKSGKCTNKEQVICSSAAEDPDWNCNNEWEESCTYSVEGNTVTIIVPNFGSPFTVVLNYKQGNLVDTSDNSVYKKK